MNIVMVAVAAPPPLSAAADPRRRHRRRHCLICDAVRPVRHVEEFVVDVLLNVVASRAVYYYYYCWCCSEICIETTMTMLWRRQRYSS